MSTQQSLCWCIKFPIFYGTRIFITVQKEHLPRMGNFLNITVVTNSHRIKQFNILFHLMAGGSLFNDVPLYRCITDTSSSCFTPFSFHAHFQFTLMNLRVIFLGLMSFGCVHSVMLTPYYWWECF